jgi:hypothetical protein
VVVMVVVLLVSLFLLLVLLCAVAFAAQRLCCCSVCDAVDGGGEKGETAAASGVCFGASCAGAVAVVLLLLLLLPLLYFFFSYSSTAAASDFMLVYETNVVSRTCWTGKRISSGSAGDLLYTTYVAILLLLQHPACQNTPLHCATDPVTTEVTKPLTIARSLSMNLCQPHIDSTFTAAVAPIAAADTCSDAVPLLLMLVLLLLIRLLLLSCRC